MSLEARDLILNLLNRNPKKRLGAGASDSEDIKKHDFFKGIDWDQVAAQQLKMPEISCKTQFDANQ